MFDYEYGTSTQKHKYRIKDMLPRLHITQNSSTKSTSFIYQFLTGFEVLDLSLVSKSWYCASWVTTVWRELSYTLSTEADIQSLYSSLDSKVTSFEKSVQKHVEDLETFQKLADCIRWKLVYITFVYNFCSNCSSKEGKLRFLPILKKTLCFSCSKLPVFSMVSIENAESEYGVTKEEIESKQLEGLKVPHTNQSGKYMFVYYLSDIISILKAKGTDPKKPDHRACIEERRRTEIVCYMREQEIPFDFIESYLNTEGSLPHNYMMGRSRMTADKIAKNLAKIYKCEKRKEARTEQKEKNERERSESPKVIKKTKLTDDEKINRKINLIERLKIMGLDTEKINFEDKTGLIYSYISGKTNKELGVVAGTIWREFKPIFTGLSEKTTQRLKDL